MENMPDYGKLAERVKTLFTIVEELKVSDDKFGEKLAELEKELQRLNITLIELKGFFKEEIGGMENRILSQINENESSRQKGELAEVKEERKWWKRTLITAIVLPILLQAIFMYLSILNSK